jgi:hypothetical protein
VPESPPITRSISNKAKEQQTTRGTSSSQTPSSPPEAYQIRKREGTPQGEHQVPETPPPIPRSISNKERGGPTERMLKLEEPSPTATTRLVFL